MGLCSSKKNIKKVVDDNRGSDDQPKQIFNPLPSPGKPMPSDSTPNPFGDSPNDEGLDQFDENGLPMRRSEEKEKGYDDRDDISSVTSGSRAVTSPRFQRRFVRHSTEDSKNDGTPRKASIGGAMLTPQKSLSDSSKSGGGGGAGSVNPEDLPFTKIGMMEKQGKRLKSFSERFFTLKEGTKIYTQNNIQ